MKEIIIEKWDEILEYMKIEHGISVVSFRTWIQPLKVYSVTDDIITISIDDSEIGDSKKFIIKKFGIPLRVSIEEIIGTTTFPSVNERTDTSGPVRNSSITIFEPLAPNT